MINPLTQPNPLHTNSAEFCIFPNAELFTSIPKINVNKFLISTFSLGDNAPFVNLRTQGIETLRLQSSYDCPHSRMSFYSLVPIFLITDELSKYVKKNDFNDSLFDREWQWKQSYNPENFENQFNYDSIVKAMLGTGYTMECSKYDGSPRLREVGIELENGDMLVCVTWEWSNK